MQSRVWIFSGAADELQFVAVSDNAGTTAPMKPMQLRYVNGRGGEHSMPHRHWLSVAGI
jgi:hypothetical protein